MQQEEKIITVNKKAFHDYLIEEKMEAGLELFGSEIKSIRKGKVQLKEAYISFVHNEAFIKGMNISKCETAGNYFQHIEDRDKRLLLHKHEIIRFASKIKIMGYTVIPLRLYLKNGRAKIEIALAKGKTLYDKRNDDKIKSMERAAKQAAYR